ncbi:ABC transporter ATP-binding protein [Bradyrhizobium sp. NP1]|uniref:ABC transporter ATP-binding protein n=1 Tax=Bradyrhizobium sp. NP1 TaxID=3049772 RepID=UPI0025A587E8|nr:ABC transporter ATP-binding protein [Bradyrhizobium sp. NP1]WJR76577.1 ABC transporter ATP-binding protein [Bradyrhizobium sp. NP1]
MVANVKSAPRVSGDAVKIRIRNLGKSFALGHSTVDAISDINLEVRKGEFVCIVGPSGCGKTTLLRILAELETPSRGEVLIMRDDPAAPLSSMIFQEASIFPWMTIRDNVAYGLKLRHVPPEQIARTVDHFIGLAGLARFADAYPHQLSGGMKQRASVARAFSNDPEILLMDEPFAALDEQNKALLQEELLRIWSETRKTVVFITHSIDEALVLGDRVLVMSRRPGTLRAEFKVEFPRPRRVYDLKADPAFGQMSRRIWTLLREEVSAP